jgi:hypothetical protein
MGMWKYVKKAFVYHWNLLAFGAGMAFAAISGHADIAVPLVLAGEVAYLGLLGTHPKYQSYVNAQEAKQSREDKAGTADQAARRIVASLPPAKVQRFESVRNRCRDLQQIARELRDPARASDAPLEGLQIAGLDRLLWTFLRLLYTEHVLDRFLTQADEGQIRRTIDNLETALRRQGTAPDDPQQQKIRKATEDNLETSKARLANLQKARDNRELVRLEIDRLENKIHTLNEMAVNRQEPEFISGQVDEVAASMVQTERTMNDLRFLTGMEQAEQDVPELLRRPAVRVEG